jgi:ribonuclease HI
MQAATPHYLLFSESCRHRDLRQWRFVLQPIEGGEHLEAADAEPEAQGERLELMAVVRGLEALEQPSRVTLVTPSKYVNRGLTYGLQEWRANNWQWELFGEMVPVKNRDLWQRIDRALVFHQLECRTWRFDLPHQRPPAAHSESDNTPGARRSALRRWLPSRLRRRWLACERWCGERRQAVALFAAQCGTRFFPLPWLG